MSFTKDHIILVVIPAPEPGSVCIESDDKKIPGHVLKILLLVLIVFGSIISAFPQSTVKIGFLIRDKNDLAIRQAAEMAIEHANMQGGYMGKKFELVTKSCDGPWGITSKQAVSLVYDDEVPIVVTALDGRNAHLAEQVIAKSHVIMLSTLSSDPTLSRAYVPWYFRIMPDDKQQSELLLNQIYKDGAQKTAVISFDDYDGRISAETYSEKVMEAGYPQPKQFIDINEIELPDEVQAFEFDAIVLAGHSKAPDAIIRRVSGSKIYAFQNLTNFMEKFDPALFHKIEFVNSIDYDQSGWDKFEKSFREKFQNNPNPSLAYVYDGILLAIHAIKLYGPDSEAIRMGFKNLKLEGITGKIIFGDFGDRIF